MRLKISRSKNSASLYVMKSTYINKVHSTKIVETLGTYRELKKKLGGKDPIEWAKAYIEKLNQEEKANKRKIIVKYSPVTRIPKDKKKLFNGGYLFLQQIYNALKLPRLCKKISKQYNFKFDLNSILSRLLYSRIIYPSSKRSTHELSKNFIEEHNFDLQHVYRALEILSEKNDIIQSHVYKASCKLAKRNDKILYYDCTNYFFEIEESDGLRQYGLSKEHRPNPIVQMGLFMDGDGIPLAYSLYKGNSNEQTTLQPLEKKILREFQFSKFVVCTDAGLSSESNRRFNSIGNRGFITTQSIKKLKGFLKEWALEDTGWLLPGSTKKYSLSEIDQEIKEGKKEYIQKVFYKERWMNENNLEQKLIVTYSFKYRNYQRKVREAQLERASSAISKNPSRIDKASATSYKRFIRKISCTSEGEVASKNVLTIDNQIAEQEALFDGFYAVCTNLENSPEEIIKINKKRWEIEECFRIMKHELKARPVYLSRDDRIEAHFLTCYLALLLYRLLEKKIGDQYTCSEIIDGLRNMNFYEIEGEGFVPTYVRNNLTDALHEAFNFRTDYQIVTTRQLKKIIKITKS